MANLTIGEDLVDYKADTADATTKKDAAIAADKAAKDADDKTKATTLRVAADLREVGPTFLQAADGSIEVYQSTDGTNVSVIVPKPASTPLPVPPAPIIPVPAPAAEPLPA